MIHYRGEPVATRSRDVRRLRECPAALATDEMRSQLSADGYLLLPGFLDRGEVLEAGNEVYRRLAAMGQLDPNRPAEEGVAVPGVVRSFAPELAVENPQVDRVIYGRRVIGLFERLFDGPVRHFDYTWLRAKSPGSDTATPPHYDVVYMGRGTHRLLTAWTPLCDVPVQMGGLMILEGSHLLSEVRDSYGSMDVDAYCTNLDEDQAVARGDAQWSSRHKGGSYDKDAIALPERLGGRWLVGDYAAGDLLVFTIFTMHASGDNLTDRMRLSTDSRYQPADEPVDERWVGERPIGHGPGAKRGVIC